MNLTFTDARIQNDNGVWLCLKVSEPAQARQFVMKKKACLYDAEIKQHREKRSLDANAYYWKLCGELAKAVGAKPEDIYRSHVKDIWNCDVLCITKKALPVFETHWTSGHLGRFIETRESKIEGCVTVLAFYGSSDFSWAEMSRLIDNCIQDCKSVGVETLPPDKIAMLKEEWGNAPRN